MSAATTTREVYAGTAERTWARRATGDRLGTAVLARLLGQHLGGRGPLTVLDVGGGNGFWSSRLAADGHRVHLADLVPDLVADAGHRGAGFTRAVCDARRLPYLDACADAVLLLGPLYGVADSAERATVLAEARRVLKPGGLLVAEIMTLLGGLRALLLRAPAAARGLDWARYRSTGRLAAPGVPAFQVSQTYLRPEDLLDELTTAGFTVADACGYDAPDTTLAQVRLGEADASVVDAWSDLVLGLGREPANWSSADQFVAIGRATCEMPTGGRT